MPHDRNKPIRIRRRTFTTAALALPLAALAAPSLAFAAPAGKSDDDAQGYLYVNGNMPNANTVVGFARHADGTLTQLPGSPFAAGGAGASGGLASQGATQVARGGQLLLVADAGSNQISVLRIHGNGRLSPVQGSPFSSNGDKPVSIAVHRDMVYVANTGSASDPGHANYSGFRLDGDGRLSLIPGSTVSVPDTAGLGDVLFNSTGTHLIGARVNTSQIDSFVVDSDGHLMAAPGSPFPGQGLGQLGSAFRPTNPSQLFVSNAHNGPGLGTVSAYTVRDDGTLMPVAGSPFADQQTAPCWVTISRDGKYLFTTNTGSGSISSYSIATDGALTLVATAALKGTPPVGAVDLGLSPDGRYLYVTDSVASAISVLAVSGGSMTELASSPVSFAAGGTPFGMAIV